MTRKARFVRVVLVTSFFLITYLYTPFSVYITPPSPQLYQYTKGNGSTSEPSERQPNSLLNNKNLMEAGNRTATGSKHTKAGGKFPKIPNTTSLSKATKGVIFTCSLQVPVDSCPCTRVIETRLAHACPTNLSAEELLQHIKTTVGESTCGDMATLRGGGQKVVSYSAFGKFPSDYYDGVGKVVDGVSDMYPGWTARLYVDPVTPALKAWVCSLACDHPHLDICNVRQLPGALGNVSGSYGMVWRFIVMGDALVDRYISRDSDSPILQRDVDAVRQWLSLGTCYHVMRDNPLHRFKMLGGMWGGCNSWRVAEARAVRDYALHHVTGRQQDQTVLGARLWPVARLNVTAHDSYFCKTYGKSLPFPTQRVNFTFVGQSTYRRKYIRNRNKTKCPLKCRPKDHQDWLYC